MNPGFLDERFIWETKTLLEDQSRSGAIVEDWSEAEFSPLWGRFEPLGAKDFPVSQKRHRETTARIQFRYRADVTADLRNVERHRIRRPRFPERIWTVHFIGVVDDPRDHIRKMEMHVEVSEVL